MGPRDTLATIPRVKPPTTSSRSFVWPPTPLPGEDVCRTAVHENPTALAPPRSLRWWRSVEQVWLDPVGLPLADRLEQCRWRPDPFGDYCDRCGSSLGEGEGSELGCAMCSRMRLPWARFVRLGAFAPPLRGWIHEVKFGRSYRLGRELGELLGTRLEPAVSAWRSANQRGLQPVLVPVPSSLRRRVSRGIDHAEVIARGAARVLGVRVERSLARSHGPSQRAVPSSERTSNIAGHFRLRRPQGVAGRLVIVIDDVMTSGATLRAASRAIRGPGGPGTARSGPGPQEIWVGVLGVTADPSRRPANGGERSRLSTLTISDGPA